MTKTGIEKIVMNQHVMSRKFSVAPMMDDTNWAASPFKIRVYDLLIFSLYHFRTSQLSLPSPLIPNLEPSRRSQHIQCSKQYRSNTSTQCIYPIPCTLKLSGRWTRDSKPAASTFSTRPPVYRDCKGAVCAKAFPWVCAPTCESAAW